jgi:hypothetical protein
VTEDLERRLGSAEWRLRQLDQRFDDFETEQQNLSRKLGYTEDVDYELRDIRSSISELDDRVDKAEEELGDRIGDAELALRRLKQHLQLIDGQLKAAAGVPAANLDTFTKDQKALAATMERGWSAKRLLLSDFDRQIHTTRVRNHQEAAAKHQAALAAALDAVGAFTSSRYGSTDHADAAARARTAIATEKNLRQALARQAPNAEESQTALRDDMVTRASKQPVIAAGERAEKRLTMALRSRLADALANRSQLPTWFVTVLGAAPPARATDQWLETATRVLLYRLTYGINDQVLALGPPPSGTDHRSHWHTQLRTDLCRW